MATKYLSVLLFTSICLLMVLTACSKATPSQAGSAIQPQAPNTSNSLSTTVTTSANALRIDARGQQNGVYDKDTNRTFITWTGGDGKVYARQYNHGNSTWTPALTSSQVQVGTATTLPTGTQTTSGLDGHYYSTIIQAKQSGTGLNKLLVFHGQHYDGPSNTGDYIAGVSKVNDYLKLNTSPNASDVSGTWTEVEIPQAPGAAYPAPVRVANGDIYVFYREQSSVLSANSGFGLRPDDRPELYIYSTDNGVTWQKSKNVPAYPGVVVGTEEPSKFAIGSWTDANNLDEVYLGQLRYQPAINGKFERINLVYTLAGGACTLSTCHDVYHKDVFYTYFQPSNKHFYCLNSSNVTGIDLGASLSKTEMDTHCRIESTGANPWDQTAYNTNEFSPYFKPIEYRQFVHWTDSGNPIVVYRRGNSNGTTQTTDDTFIVKSTFWTGSSWSSGTVGNTGYPQDIDKVGDKSFILYFSNRITYTTDDGGATWTQGTTLTLPTGSAGFRTISVVDGYRDPMRLVVSEENTSAPPVPPVNMYTIGIGDCSFTGNYRVQSQSLSDRYLHGVISPVKTDLVVFNSTDVNQKWTIEDVSGDNLRWCRLKFQSGSNTYYLHYNSSTTKPDLVANPSTTALSDSSYWWKIEHFDDGWYTLRNDPPSSSSKYLSAPATGTDTITSTSGTLDVKIRWQLDPAN
jgi:hypothetical protein